MKIKTSELTGAALDWAVAKCEGIDFAENGWKPLNVFLGARVGGHHRYSTDPAHSHPIIERERIATWAGESCWYATYPGTRLSGYDGKHGYIDVDEFDSMPGPTPLIAAMRCFVASKLSDEVDVPEELL